jgi:hypothetical protein
MNNDPVTGRNRAKAASHRRSATYSWPCK